MWTSNVSLAPLRKLIITHHHSEIHWELDVLLNEFTLKKETFHTDPIKSSRVRTVPLNPAPHEISVETLTDRINTAATTHFTSCGL